ncbi:MAG: tetratricopeptide repeat protein [Bacteroidales bacterium]
MYNNIGEVYRLSGDYEKALNYYRSSVDLNLELNNQINLAVNYDNIGNIFMNQNEYDSAFHYLERSLSISEEINDEKRTQ